MAGLAGKDITSTYKDVLNVFDTVQNEGLTSSAKRIFDGAGIGSPVWMSTSLLQVGTESSNANLKVHGSITAKSISLKKPTGGAEYAVFNSNDEGTVNVMVGLITKSSVKFQAAGHDDLVMDAASGAMKKGDGSKGNITLGNTEVVLKKGTTDLLTAKDDGTIRFQNISSGSEPTPTTGDLAIIDGELQIGV